ncbi:hypothetical protein EWH72_14825 [Enterococcus faecium]|nr:hypothetical protein EWH72_14825 [Enterococcus faecium]
MSVSRIIFAYFPTTAISYKLFATKRGVVTKFCHNPSFLGSIIYGTDESELILQPHFYFRY